jgi:hypothetical protein
MRDWLFGLAFPVWLVATFGIGLVFAEWAWLRAIIDWPLLWLPTMACGALVAIPLVIAGFIAPPSNRG